MTKKTYLKNLTPPAGEVDVVLDTDAFNEIDDQFAISYLIRSSDKLKLKALYAAPFFNENSSSALDGMEKSYHEIFRLQRLLGTDYPVFRGSKSFLSSETVPEESDAAHDLASRAMSYSPEKPLYVIAIGAITNVASALLINPEIAERIVVVWLGGHSRDFSDTREFNMMSDYAAARVVISSAAPFVQLPCFGVVSSFALSEPELSHWLVGKNPLATYLAENTARAANSYAKGEPWTRVIWDVCAVAWLLNSDERFMRCRIAERLIPTYEGEYSELCSDAPMCYTYYIERDALMHDLISKLLM